MITPRATAQQEPQVLSQHCQEESRPPTPTHNMMFTLLPNDVILCILSFASPNDIRKCRQLSHRFQTVIDNSPHLQLVLTLDHCGYTEAINPRKDLNHAEKIQILYEHKARRSSPCSLKPTEIEVPAPRILDLGVNLFDYHQGVYAQYSRLVERVFLYQLPSANHGAEFRQWEHTSPSDQIVGLAIDASHDLLVWLEARHQEPYIVEPSTSFQYQYRIHLRSLASNKSHPMAEFDSIIPHNFSSHGRTIAAHTIHTIGSLLAILFVSARHRVPCHIVVWDWTIGVELIRAIAPGGKHTSFAFISDRLFIVSRNSSFFEEDIETVTGTYGRIDVYSLDHLSYENSLNIGLPVMHLSLPQLPHQLSGSGVMIRRAPSSASSTHTLFDSRPRLYDLPPCGDVVCLDIHTWPVQHINILNEPAPRGTLLIPAKAIRTIFHTLDIQDYHQPHPSPPIHVPWLDWAHVTCWVDTAISDFRPTHAAHGKHFAALKSSRNLPAANSPDEIVVFGFDQPSPSPIGDQYLTAAGFFNGEVRPKRGTATPIWVDQAFLPLTSVFMDDEFLIVQANWREEGYTLLVYNF